jgi:hypothetical protein
MSQLYRLVLFFVFTLMAVNVNASYILLLGDDYSETFIAPYLIDEGHEVTSESTYYDWNGNIPSETDVIIYLDGYEYDYALGEFGDDVAANAAILNFVANGGGLIFTEWNAYDEKKEKVADLMPVSYNGEYYYQATWQVASGRADHFLVTDLLSTSFVEGDDTKDTYSDVIPRLGTEVVMDDGNGIPLLSFTNKHGGRVIHINDGMAFDEEISEEILSIINRSVLFAEQPLVSVPEPPIFIFVSSILFFLVNRKNYKHSI